MSTNYSTFQITSYRGFDWVTTKKDNTSLDVLQVFNIVNDNPVDLKTSVYK